MYICKISSSPPPRPVIPRPQPHHDVFTLYLILILIREWNLFLHSYIVMNADVTGKWHHRDSGMLRSRTYLPLSSLTSYGLPQSPDARFPKKGHVGPDKGPINRKLSPFLTLNPAPRQLIAQAPFCRSIIAA